MRSRCRSSWSLLSLLLLWGSGARAGEVVPNPYAPTHEPVVFDFSRGAQPAAPAGGVRFSELDRHRDDVPAADLEPGQLPAGWVQQGGVVVPRAIADGADVRSPAALGELQADPHANRDKVDGPDAQDLCAFPDETPEGIYSGKFDRGSEYPRHGTIYMNYTGGVLQNGGENSAENQSTLAKTGHMFPVYTGGEERAVAVAQAVQADFAEMAVRVVYLERPPKLLPYAMIMMGGSYKDTAAGPSGGVAPGADCEDVGLRNVCYAFVNHDGVTTQSNVASQELGHTMGLGHTYGDDRVMAFGYDTNSPIDMGFGDECTTVLIAAGQSGYCSGINKCHCGGDGKQQHDLKSLKAIYAPPGPDLVPPTIAITAPEDGATFPPGENITVAVDPHDDFGGYGWELVVSQGDEVLAELVDYQIAQSFLLKGLPPGTYTLTARVQDHADQVGEDFITVTVAGGSSSDTDTPTTSDGDASSSGEAGTSGGASQTGDDGLGSTTADADGADTSGMASDDGCSCRGSAPAPSFAALAALALLLRRRRARA